MKNVKCPVCESPGAVEKIEKNPYPLTLGKPVVVEESIISCDNCGERSFSNPGAKNAYVVAMAAARKQLCGELVDQISTAGYSMARVERAFQLPPRTMNRWKSANESSATALAFLRLLVTFPFLVEVAEHRFDKHDSERLQQIAAEKYNVGTDITVEIEPPISAVVPQAPGATIIQFPLGA